MASSSEEIDHRRRRLFGTAAMGVAAAAGAFSLLPGHWAAAGNAFADQQASQGYPPTARRAQDLLFLPRAR